MNFSKQRDVVVKFLQGSKDHPTPEQVYEAVKEKAPNIGIATVYRNLKKLKDNNQVVTITTPDNKEHYDYDTGLHAHLHCTCCSKLNDIELSPKQIDTITAINDNNFDLLFIGLCDECKIKKEGGF